ncbi:MAG: methyltransferase domain-containing protein [bacterium]
MDKHVYSKQNKLILEQFSKTAESFINMQEHSNETAMKLFIEQVELNKEDNVLDVACGPGIVGCAFAEIAKKITGIDLTPDMITKAQQLQSDKGLNNISWDIGDVYNLPYKNNTFNKVISRYAFHHFINPELVLNEMIRVSKENGIICVADAATSPEKNNAYNQVEKLRDPSHTRALTIYELEKLFIDKGFSDIKIAFYRLEMDLEEIIRSSIMDDQNIDKIKTIFQENLKEDKLDMNAYLKDDKIRFSFPLMIISGKKISTPA